MFWIDQFYCRVRYHYGLMIYVCLNSQHRMRDKVEISQIIFTVQPCQIFEKYMQNAILFVFLISFWAIEFSCILLTRKTITKT